MAGNEHRRMVIQPRDEHLLREIALMRIVDREQAKTVAGFHSTTRANARLLVLVNAGLLRRFFQGTTAGGKKALYTLSPKGSQFVGVPYRAFRHGNDELLVTNFFVAHQLAVNEVYCLARYGLAAPEGLKCTRWLAFSEKIAQGISLIPDGYFEIAAAQGLISAFLEVDLGNEGLAVWKEKTRNYLQYAATGIFREQFGQKQFRALVVANNESRVQAIRKVVSSLTEKVFWFSTLEALRREGLWGPVWLRPSEETLRSFL
jgi:hypothetical protein